MFIVFSDTHGRSAQMEKALSAAGDKAAAVFHLGDFFRDTYIINEKYPNTPLYRVAGNCDGFASGIQTELEAEIAGKKFFITHGHRYSVKSGYESIMAAAKSRGADVCLFGHTHCPEVFTDSGILFMNPGSAYESRSEKRPTYGVLRIGSEITGVIVKV